MYPWTCIDAEKLKKKTKKKKLYGKKEKLTPEGLCVSEGEPRFDSYMNQEHGFCWHFQSQWRVQDSCLWSSSES